MESVGCAPLVVWPTTILPLPFHFRRFVRMVIAQRCTASVFSSLRNSRQSAAGIQEEREVGQSIWRSRFFFHSSSTASIASVHTGVCIWHGTQYAKLFFLFFVKKWENSHISLIRNGLIKAIIVMSWCQQSRRRARQPHYWANNNKRVSNNNASDYCLALVRLHRLDWIIPVLPPRKSTDLPFLSHEKFLHFFSSICSMQLQRHRIGIELHTFSPSSFSL